MNHQQKKLLLTSLLIGIALCVGFIVGTATADNGNPKAECVYAIVQHPGNNGPLPECVSLTEQQKAQLFGELLYYDSNS